MEETKKGITVKVDAELHAEVKRFIEENNMTMAEFVSRALENELHPKINETEVKGMEKMRTVAFQTTDDLFERLNDYLHRHGLKKNQFFIDFINKVLEEDQAMQTSKEQDSHITEDAEAEFEKDIEEETEDELESEEADEAFDDEIENEDQDNEYEDDESIEETDEEDEELNEDEFDEEDQDDDYDEDEEESEGMSIGM